MSDTSFDLGTNSELPLSVNATDANGNAVPGVTPVWSSSDESVIILEDQSDGSTLAVRVSKDSASAVVSAIVTNADGSSTTGTIAISLAAQGTGGTGAGNVTDVTIVPGTPS